MIKYINKLNIDAKSILWASIFSVAIFICLIPLMFFNYIAYPTGWLLGCTIGVICFYLLTVTADLILKTKSKWLYIVLPITRPLIYAVGLVISGLTTFYWQIDVFNVFMVFGGYLFVIAITLLYTYFGSKKAQKESSEA